MSASVVAPRATCRLQLTPEFGFSAVADLVPHMASLGISHLYLSPVFEAVPGSSHGYDITDPRSIRREFGGREGLDELVAACDRAGTRIIIDIVPNHMSASHHNPWWYDVLKHGRNSRFAEYFDIFWDAAERDVVVLPVLGRSLDDVIAAGELRVEESDRGPELAYFEHRFPLSESSARMASTAKPYDVRNLLRLQHYELMYWRVGLQQLNYRRFFDIAGLVGMRVGYADVLAATHALIFDLVKSGVAAGVRVDHIDGLREPGRYLDRLRDAVHPAKPYVVIEKILAPGEDLPPAWAVNGTTGYEWLNLMNGVLVDPDGLERLSKFRQRFTDDQADFQQTVARSKRDVMDQLFHAELTRLAHTGVQLGQRLGARVAKSADYVTAIKFVTGQLRGYRTYVGDPKSKSEGTAGLPDSVFEAFYGRTEGQSEALRVLRRALHQDVPQSVVQEAVSLVEQWQQVSGAVAGKGVEDTAFYRYTALLSMNEVGGEPERTFTSPDRFHSLNQSNVEKGRLSLLPTSTHDTKWSEDARARLNVISEVSEEWCGQVEHWSRLNASLIADVGGRRCPAPDAELRFYQVLAAVLPPESGEVFNTVTARVSDYMIKAAREAKLDSTWLDVNHEYEERLQQFVHEALKSPDGATFRASFAPMAGRLAFHGAVNSLAQIVLKVCSPGVPDFYQGCEAWDLSLVDPDNRRPVSWSTLAERLDRLMSVPREQWVSTIRALFNGWRDGAVKQWVTARSLRVREDQPELLAAGEYVSVQAEGPAQKNIIAFERRGRGTSASVVAAVCRFSTELGGSAEALTSGSAWGETAIKVKAGDGTRFTDALTGQSYVSKSGRLDASDIFGVLPVALLVHPDD